jgi:hypothetical protein
MGAVAVLLAASEAEDVIPSALPWHLRRHTRRDLGDARRRAPPEAAGTYQVGAVQIDLLLQRCRVRGGVCAGLISHYTSSAANLLDLNVGESVCDLVMPCRGCEPRRPDSARETRTRSGPAGRRMPQVQVLRCE